MADEKVLGPENQGDDTPAIDVLQDYFPQKQNQGPVIPGTNMPLPAGLTQGAAIAPPTPPAAPSGPASPTSGVDAIATMYFKHLLDRQPPAPQAATPAPGGFADKLRGALSGFQSSLGDAAAATENLPSGVGGLGGIERTFRARSERQAGEKQRSFENQQALNREKRENALNNIQMSIHELQLQKAKKELQDDLYGSNKVASKAREEGGFDVEHGVSESEISRRMDSFKGPNNEHYTDLYDLMPVSRTEINGKPETQFDVVTKKAGNIVPTDQERSFIRDNGGPDLTEGTAVPNNSLVAMRLAAQRTASGRQMIEDATGKQLSTEKAKQLNADLQSSVVQHAMSTNLEDPISGLMDAKQSADAHVQQFSQLLQAAQAHGDPAAIQEAQQHLAQVQREKKSLDNVFTFGITKEDLENHRKYLEDVEKKRHNIAEETIAAKKAAGTEETEPWAQGLFGQDYLSALRENRPGDAGTVTAIGEGRQLMPPRLSKDGLRMSNMVNRAYPDWDQTLGKTWPSARNEYMGSGKTATFAIPAYNAAIRHMADLLENTTYAGVMNPGSDAYQRRQAGIGFVREELGKAVAAGVMAESDKKDFEDKLTGGLTPGLKRERIQQAARLLHDKLDEFQTKFEAAKPSAHINVPKLMSPEAMKAFDYVLSEGKTAKPESQGQTVAAPPKGFEGKIGVEAGEGTNRKTHYFNTQAEADNFKKLLAGNQ